MNDYLSNELNQLHIQCNSNAKKHMPDEVSYAIQEL